MSRRMTDRAPRPGRRKAPITSSLVVWALLLQSAAARDRDLIGWSEDFSSNQAAIQPGNAKERGVQVLSWDPRIFLYRGLLTDEECDKMVAASEPRLSRSGVVDTDTGAGETNSIRTSYGMFFDRGETAWLTEIERRLSEWTMIPVGHGEGIQVLRYESGQEYKPHFDYFFHPGAMDNGGNRLATILMYLSTPVEGGETVFPNVPRPASQTTAAGFSECAAQGLAVRPRKGDAVLFWSLRTDGTLDRGALHGSCPVLNGTKWAATKWFHVAHYALGAEKAQKVQHVVFAPPPPPAPPGCKDQSRSCPDWAEGGECQHNPGYMVGTKEQPGACLLSCNRCDLMPRAAVAE